MLGVGEVYEAWGSLVPPCLTLLMADQKEGPSFLKCFRHVYLLEIGIGEQQ